MQKDKTDVCIIGGGIIGLCSAYYLNKEGFSVSIIDKGPKEQASSHANCGLVSTSHILPLNDVSLIVKSLKWLFKKDAPFYIQPRLDTKLWSWLIRFMQQAGKKHILHNLESRHLLLKHSTDLYVEMIKAEAYECDWQRDGFLFLFKSEKEFEHFKEENEVLSRYGYGAQPYVGKELFDLEPAVHEKIYGGWLQKADNWLKPDVLVKGIKATLQEQGVSIFENTEIVQFNVNGKIKSITSKDGNTFEADSFVLASGAWTPLFKKWTQLNIPIVPAKGYSITMKSPELMPKIPINMTERKVVATPFGNSYRLGSTLEFVGYNESINRSRLEALKNGAAEYLKDPYTDEVYEEWYGWRPMTPDGVPIIDRSPVHKNLWLACGHNMLGISMATSSGKLVSELIAGKETHIDAKRYAFDRF